MNDRTRGPALVSQSRLNCLSASKPTNSETDVGRAHSAKWSTQPVATAAGLSYCHRMDLHTYIPYEPLNVLKAFAEDVWIVDGPEIGVRFLGATIHFPTRMTIIRLPSGKLWIHSPIAWNDDLASAIANLGPTAFLVAPNTMHYWFLPDWQAKFPAARVYGPPGLLKSARRPVELDEELSAQPPEIWEGCIDQCLSPGLIFTEMDFFHRPSRTLILTDLIENFELSRVRQGPFRWALWLFGGADPDGTAPQDLRWNFVGHRHKVRAAVQRMIGWTPERIVLAHGRCYASNAVAELRRGFRWVL